MPRANQPLPTRQLSLFPPSCPGPDRTSLPSEPLDSAARLMARVLERQSRQMAYLEGAGEGHFAGPASALATEQQQGWGGEGVLI